MMHLEPRVIGYIVTALVVAVVLAVRLRRMRKARPLKLERLWIIPALLICLAGVLLYKVPPAPSDLPWLVLAVVMGAGLGWVRGGMMVVEVEPETHALNMRTSPEAMAFIVGLLVLRLGLRTTLSENAAAWGLHAAMVTDALVVFAVVLIAVQRVEIAIRARRLLRLAREARAA